MKRNRLETAFDATFASTQALREKQIQQNYRPIIGIHKWFARRPGTLFRSLLLAEFAQAPLPEAFWEGQSCRGVVADPFMGGGTTLYEASRLGLSVVGNDINPMSAWLIERAFDGLDVADLLEVAGGLAEEADRSLGELYKTTCQCCGQAAEVKYFLWVKTCTCPGCDQVVDAFPGHLLAENVRHPNYVVGCTACGELNEVSSLPSAGESCCAACGSKLTGGNYKRGKVTCPHCDLTFGFPSNDAPPPEHRMWAIEYRCAACYGSLQGRQFKRPDADDFERYENAKAELQTSSFSQLIPEDAIPKGDETARLHRWGYRTYRQMFNDRQLLSLSYLFSKTLEVPSAPIRYALLTVISDILRYNNMLCRYDTYALKCQDIFSVHGFPVGLVQCENNVLGIPKVGSGGFRHFVEKYARAKNYCAKPFETAFSGKKKVLVFPDGETIGADNCKSVSISCLPSQDVPLEPGSLDGVFTDPPYFANVQYSELIDFCYVWLRKAIDADHHAFASISTRSDHEATGNSTAGRGLEEFTNALSLVYQNFCGALKPGAPLVFTYHHNDPLAYVPLVVAVLDSGMVCTAVFPAAAEMSASLHIANTSSSVVDSVFVCRTFSDASEPAQNEAELEAVLQEDIRQMAAAGVKVSGGDVRCLLAGRLAGLAINSCHTDWQRSPPIAERMNLASEVLRLLMLRVGFDGLAQEALAKLTSGTKTRLYK
ncbi:DUF1156 domain-containing protein [Frateuria edaphi]|uniref:DUF1156 domain-containing protein n=1 Tax=Frateuria edaphi TaxID=2898793 RepID=UPI001E3D51DB|nr:DUF1156 domain-containing protein [Frateuria edaphi]UGB46594.1 DUF1156 domain-containing protein [Frateuria edaphi]